MESQRLQKEIEKYGVHAALGPRGLGWGIEQNPYELAVFLTSIPHVRTVLEVGTGYRGGLAMFLAEIMGLDVTTIDIREYDTQQRSARVRYIVSPERPEFEKKFDLVFIDSDHTYRSVGIDYHHYRKYGGVVALHDIAGLRDCKGVARFWNETARTPKRHQLRKGFHEIIADDEYRAGIGWKE